MRTERSAGVIGRGAGAGAGVGEGASEGVGVEVGEGAAADKASTATVSLPCARSPSPLGKKMMESGTATVEVAGLKGTKGSALSFEAVVYATPQGICMRAPVESGGRN